MSIQKDINRKNTSFQSEYLSALNNVKCAIENQQLEQACALYTQYAETMFSLSRKIRKLYGILITGYQVPGCAIYPVIFEENRSADLFKLRVKRCAHQESDHLPAPLKRAIRLAVKDHGERQDWKKFTVDFFPPIQIGDWTSHDNLNLPYTHLDQDSDSYSAALYVATRDLLMERQVDYPPVATGCLLEEGRFVPPDAESLRHKRRADISNRLKVPLDESPDVFYHRAYLAQKERGISEIQRELRGFRSLPKDARFALFQEALKALQHGRGQHVLNATEITEIYLNTFILASHLDRLEEVNDLFPVFEYRLKSSHRYFYEYICLRINHQIANESADSIFQMIHDLLGKHTQDVNLTPATHAEVMSQPVELCMIWNTLSQALWMDGRVDEALQCTDWAIERAEGNYADLLRYRCRRGQLLGLRGPSGAQASYDLLSTIKSELNNLDVREHRGIQSSRVYVLAYLARAAALLNLGEESYQTLIESERYGGSSELMFVQQEVRFRLVGLDHCDFSEERERWLSAQNELTAQEKKSYTKLRLIDRVELVQSRAESYAHGRIPVISEDRPLYQIQLDDTGRCATY
jgi:hypothetical protein